MIRTTAIKAGIWGLLCWFVSFIAALQLGATSDASMEVISQLRLPRALLASAVGMGLSVSGAVLQALFSNPLCEPYTLGISSGAALGAVLGISLGLQFAFGGLVSSAFVGALVFAFVLYLIALRPGSSNLTLLLSGVMLGFFGSSLVALWMALTDANGIQSAFFWLMGDLSRARLHSSIFSFVGMLILTLLIVKKWRVLDGLLLGEEAALSLGVDVLKSRKTIILLVSLLIGLSVSSSGMIGFIGLVVPHFVRQFVGSLHRKVLPVAAIWGAAALTAADTLARISFKPYELPVGIVTAIVGAPLFLWVMLKQKGRV